MIKSLASATMPVIISYLAIFAANAQAAWVSSGGKIVGDDGNPWWLSNTHAATYCVEVDEATVSVPHDKVELLLGEAITYWLNQFKNEDGDPSYALGTQAFTRVACNEGTPDLRVQVGPGTLSAAQKQFFGDRIDEIVGIAVRTDYDEVNLRGRGFIYIRDDAQQLIDWRQGQRLFHPWSHDQRLLRVLIHELGHVFGLPHIPDTLMDEQAPDQWYKNDFFDDTVSNVPAFAGVDLSNTTCQFNGVNIVRTRAYFDLAEDKQCVTIVMDNHGAHGKVMAARDQGGSSGDDLGELHGNGQRSTGRSLVQIYLNPHQRVFSTQATMVNANLAAFDTTAEEIIYRPNGPNARDHLMVITRSLTRYQVMGVVDTDHGPALTSLIWIERKFGDWIH